MDIVILQDYDFASGVKCLLCNFQINYKENLT